MVKYLPCDLSALNPRDELIKAQILPGNTNQLFIPRRRRSALQVLHKACEASRRFNYFPGGIALTWMAFYESCINSEQSCVNEWNAMTDLETTRPDSPTMFVDRSGARRITPHTL